MWNGFKLFINLITKKPKTMSKLIDILKSSKENGEAKQLDRQAKQANINTQQEILDIQNQIEQSDAKIEQVILANPFSASKLYEARMNKELLERKLKAINEILKELF